MAPHRIKTVAISPFAPFGGRPGSAYSSSDGSSSRIMRGEAGSFAMRTPTAPRRRRFPVAAYRAVEVRELAGVDLRKPVAHLGEA